MKKNTVKIPILSAAALITLLSAGCAQYADDTETSVYSFVSKSTTETATKTETKTETKTQTETETAPETTTTTKTTKQSRKKKKSETTASEEPASETTVSTVSEYTGLIKSPEEFEIYDTDGCEWDYEFVYDGRIYEAIYTAEPENWKIIDSYKITDHSDMTIICKALSDIHPIHGKDYITFRTPEDMVYEWEQHNLAYKLLPDSNSWKQNARDVDLDPEDQGKGLYELYKARTGGDILPAG